MRRRPSRTEMPDEQQLAIGLVWGHLNAYQYEEAFDLAAGCLELWPDNVKLRLMCDFAAAEILEPVDRQRLLALRTPENGEWVDLILRRLTPDA